MELTKSQERRLSFVASLLSLNPMVESLPKILVSNSGLRIES
jgi:hypothetical protein